MDQPQPPPPLFMTPARSHNGLGVAAFLTALVGLATPTGLVSLLALVLGLAAIGRAPRGFATAGLLLGLLGTFLWVSVMLVAVIAALVGLLVAVVATAGLFVLTQPEAVEITGDMVNAAIAVHEYQREHDGIPEDLGTLGLGVATGMDPWGGRYRLERAEADPGFDLVSGGPDGAFDTDDDVRLSGLGEFWEQTLASFGTRMNALGEWFDRAGHHSGRCPAGRDGTGPGVASRYEQAARGQILTEEQAEEPAPAAAER